MKSREGTFFILSKLSVILPVLFLSGLLTTASAATFYWAGANGANWNDVNNWSSTASPFTAVSSFPTSADIVRVSENSVTIPSGFDAVASYIVVNTNDEAKPARIIVQQGGSLTCASNNGGSGACLYLRGGAIINDGTITLNLTNTPSGFGLTFENSTVAGVKTASSYSGNGMLKINAAGQTNGGALKFIQTVANPVFTVNNTNNYQFNLADGRWPFTVLSGSKVVINGTGTIDFGTSTTPSAFGLFNLASNNAALTVESDVTLNSKCNGSFSPENGIINIGNFSEIKFTNNGSINIQTNGVNGIFCGSVTTAPNTILNSGNLNVDGGAAIVFSGSGSASITNTGTLSAVNVPSNSYSAGVSASGIGPYIIKNTAPGTLNLASGLGISAEIMDDFPLVNQVLIDPQTPANTRPFLIDNQLPSYSQSHNWDVFFSDEFNDTKMDVTKWSIDYRTFNQPLITVYSDDDQVEEKDGNIYLYYRKSQTDPTKYYVGRFFSKQKFSTAYGYFECRMHPVRPQGYQTAFWMMPDQEGGLTPNGVKDGTAHDGAEIDIFEGIQYGDKYWTGLHWDGYGAEHQNIGKEITAPGLHSEEYHIFGFEWAPSFLKYYYNGIVVRIVNDPKLIPKVPHFIYLSGAIWSEIGWSEMSVLDNAFLNSGGVDKAYIDYVRVFKNRATYPPGDELPEGFTGNTIFMDNADSTGVTITGSWVTAINSTPYFKSNYLHDNNQGKGLKSVSFNPALNQTGKYEIYAYYPSESNRSTKTRYIIKRAEGDTIVLVDQTKNGSSWISLGRYNLLKDNSPKVILSNAGTTGYVIADGVAFVPIDQNTAVNDLNRPLDIVSIYADNNEIVVRFNEQTSGPASIDIFNTNGVLIKSHKNIDVNSLHQTVRLKPRSHNSSAMHFVKVTIDGYAVCKKVITY
jgi:beta-glucanase (GH16 family)